MVEESKSVVASTEAESQISQEPAALDNQTQPDTEEESKAREPIWMKPNSVKELDAKLEAFKKRFDDMNRVFLANLAASFGACFKDPEEYKTQPAVKTAKQAARHMLEAKKITLLTGAGISAASGIPTFRGQDGFWKDQKRYAGESDPTQVLTRSFFDENPMAVWEWHYDFIKLAKDKTVNDGHRAIAKFQEYSAKTPGLESILVTQNIDDLHAREIKRSPTLQRSEDPYCQLDDTNRLAFTPHLYEIHGNVHYMHCSDESQEHSKTFFKGPSLADFERALAEAPEKTVTNAEGLTQSFCLVPRCQECDAVMKPHCMFFDETYSEHYYRKETVKAFVEESDCLIVVGTALATNLAKQIVATVLNKEMPVIEVNLESAIERGNNIQVVAKSEIALPELFEEYYRLKEAQGQRNATQSQSSSASKSSTAMASKGKKVVRQAPAKNVSPKSSNSGAERRVPPKSSATASKRPAQAASQVKK